MGRRAHIRLMGHPHYSNFVQQRNTVLSRVRLWGSTPFRVKTSEHMSPKLLKWGTRGKAQWLCESSQRTSRTSCHPSSCIPAVPSPYANIKRNVFEPAHLPSVIMSYDEFNPKQGRTSFPPNGRDHTQWFEYCGQTLSKLQMVKDADYLIPGTLICCVTFMYSSNVSTSVSSLTVQYIYIYIYHYSADFWHSQILCFAHISAITITPNNPLCRFDIASKVPTGILARDAQSW